MIVHDNCTGQVVSAKDNLESLINPKHELYEANKGTMINEIEMSAVSNS
jgi:hypothetical protein